MLLAFTLTEQYDACAWLLISCQITGTMIVAAAIEHSPKRCYVLGWTFVPEVQSVKWSYAARKVKAIPILKPGVAGVANNWCINYSVLRIKS